MLPDHVEGLLGQVSYWPSTNPLKERMVSAKET